MNISSADAAREKPENPADTQDGSKPPSSKTDETALREDAKEIILRLNERRQLMTAAKLTEQLGAGAGIVLQTRPTEAKGENESKRFVDNFAGEVIVADVGEAVKYRLAVADLFVEKAQFHLESRAKGYQYIGFVMYSLAILIFATGAYIAVSRMRSHDLTPRPAVAAPGQILEAKPFHTAAAADSPALALKPATEVPARVATTASSQAWIDLITRFVLAFTGYGFIVLTAVALARGARACLDQRERLLAKRHSLRQGRLYLHLTGGHVTIEEMERAFNWNHEQHNAFTHMPTDTKAPWGNVLEEIVKITPELVKAGVNVAREASEKSITKDTEKKRVS